MTILELMNLLRPHWFALSEDGTDSWLGWRTLLAALFAEEMTDPEMLAIFEKFTGRKIRPREAIREAWIIVGRGGGKSLITALIITYIAVFVKHPTVTKGQTAVCLCLASDKAQAQVILNYVFAFFDTIELLRGHEASRTAESLTLKNDITLEVMANSQGGLRGRVYVAVANDEISFWSSEGPNRDEEVIGAIKPRLVPNGMMVSISSPYASQGALYSAYEKHYGQDKSNVLIWMADSFSMNPLLDAAKIERERSEDPARMDAEYGFGFRSTRGGFLTKETIDACTLPGRMELPPSSGYRYQAFVDMAGGSGADCATLAIGHADAGGNLVVDLLREAAPPFDPEVITKQFCKELRRYRISAVVGDRFGGDYPPAQFRRWGIEYQPSAKNKSELYLEMLPLLNSRKVELLDIQRLKSQLLGLERRVGTSRGSDSIDHPRSGHDDLANSVAGALVNLSGDDNWELGLIEFSKNPAKAEIALVAKQAEAGLRPAPNTWTEVLSAKCPKCEAMTTNRIIGNSQWKCGACGNQWPTEAAQQRSRDPFGGPYQGGGGSEPGGSDGRRNEKSSNGNCGSPGTDSPTWSDHAADSGACAASLGRDQRARRKTQGEA